MNTQDQRPRTGLLIVVAHGLEARALLERFDLRLIQPRPFRLYASASGLALTISGMGKTASAAATAHACATLCREEDSLQMPGLLNYGIAGHGAAAVGTSFMVNRIMDAGSGRSYYPTLRAGLKASTALITVDRPELEYPEAVAYDMEASGFWAAGSSMTEPDRIQIFKLISDNPSQHASRLGKTELERVLSKAVEPAVALISELLQNNMDHIARHGLPGQCHQVMQKLGLTQTQRHQFRKLFFRYSALGRQQQWQELIASRREPRALIQRLTVELAADEADCIGADSKSVNWPWGASE